MGTLRREQIVHVLFDVGVIAKGVDGVLEIVGGVLFFLISPSQLHYIVRLLTQHELTEDSHDVVANYLLHISQDPGAKTFGATYLLWHGVVKAGLVTALLRKRRWAYPVAIVAFLLFLVYQLYRYSHTHEPGLLLLSVLDVAVIVLTWFEYQRLRTSQAFSSGNASTAERAA